MAILSLILSYIECWHNSSSIIFVRIEWKVFKAVSDASMQSVRTAVIVSLFLLISSRASHKLPIFSICFT